MKKRKNNNTNAQDNKFLAGIVKKIFELLMSIFGLKMGGDGPPPTNEEVAQHIKGQQNLGDHLENNSEKLSVVNKLLAIPGASAMAEKMAKDAIKPYLDNKDVKNALQGQLDGPQGDKIRDELAKYPNICKLMNKLAQKTESASLAKDATQKVSPHNKHEVPNANVDKQYNKIVAEASNGQEANMTPLPDAPQSQSTASLSPLPTTPSPDSENDEEEDQQSSMKGP